MPIYRNGVFYGIIGVEIPANSFFNHAGFVSQSNKSEIITIVNNSSAAVITGTVMSQTASELYNIESGLVLSSTVTQKLKGVTQQIPQQAILRKTGIIADQDLSDAQKQAAKSRTARISLSDAMGVAPVKNEAAPMKTIRIKRPVDIPGAAKSPEPAAAVGPAAEKSAEAAAEVKSETAAEAPSTVTQRKTLKISRPTGGAVRPGGKFGIKRAGAATPAPAAAKISGSETSAADTGDAVADIADIPPLPMPPPPVAAEPVSDVPGWVTSLSAVVQIAACIVIGALAWLLYSDSQILPF